MSEFMSHGAARYDPVREAGGWCAGTQDLFMIEGATEFEWLGAPQEQQVWIPDSAEGDAVAIRPDPLEPK